MKYNDTARSALGGSSLSLLFPLASPAFTQYKRLSAICPLMPGHGSVRSFARSLSPSPSTSSLPSPRLLACLLCVSLGKCNLQFQLRTTGHDYVYGCRRHCVQWLTALARPLQRAHSPRVLALIIERMLCARQANLALTGTQAHTVSQSCLRSF